MMKILKVTYGATMIGFLGWFTLSYLDVVMHNLTTANYHPWNLIWMLFG